MTVLQCITVVQHSYHSAHYQGAMLFKFFLKFKGLVHYKGSIIHVDHHQYAYIAM